MLEELHKITPLSKVVTSFSVIALIVATFFIGQLYEQALGGIEKQSSGSVAESQGASQEATVSSAIDDFEYLLELDMILENITDSIEVVE